MVPLSSFAVRNPQDVERALRKVTGFATMPIIIVHETDVHRTNITH